MENNIEMTLSAYDVRLLFKSYVSMVNKRLSFPKTLKEDMHYNHIESEMLNMHDYLNEVRDLVFIAEKYGEMVTMLEAKEDEEEQNVPQARKDSYLELGLNYEDEE